MDTARAGWLARRRLGLGGSDVANALGLGYQTPLDVYLAKRGLAEPREPSIPMRVGTALEDLVAEMYAEREGVSLERFELAELPMQRRGAPWMLASPDRLVRGTHRGLEVKCPGIRQRERWGPAGTDEVPEPYLVQVAWYLAVLDYDAWDIAALFGNEEMRVYHISRDRALEDVLLSRAEHFWTTYVIAGVPPPAGPRDGETLARLYPRHVRDALVPAPLELDPIAARLASVRAEQQRLEEQRETLEVALKAAIGDAAGVEGRGWRATWKATRDGTRVDWDRAVRDGSIPRKVIECYTEPRPGVRRFLFRTEEED